MFRALKQLKIWVYYSLSAYISLRSPGIQFRTSLDITSLYPEFRGTGGYCSALDVPLKSLFKRSLSAKCLIVSCYHDKTSRYSRVFLSTVFRPVSPVVFFCSSFLPNMAVSALLRNKLLKIGISKIKNSRIF